MTVRLTPNCCASRAGLRTLAELTLRVPRRKRWWSGIAGLGRAVARQVEGFFAAHPDLTAMRRCGTRWLPLDAHRAGCGTSRHRRTDGGRAAWRGRFRGRRQCRSSPGMGSLHALREACSSCALRRVR
ncbi:hypothetical protein HHL10_17435 [Azohydromonas sp. G-1-1-14]|uniref:Uncharacterized protein n=1 Tax=Azohydromonas caseinilytica TaxID=2728836 RepID=A0A848FBS9_9BURK|nr:hypothetical protein [Azohydromonas caseinilytica]